MYLTTMYIYENSEKTSKQIKRFNDQKSIVDRKGKAPLFSKAL